jgi:hypothetical protein
VLSNVCLVEASFNCPVAQRSPLVKTVSNNKRASVDTFAEPKSSPRLRSLGCVNRYLQNWVVAWSWNLEILANFSLIKALSVAVRRRVGCMLQWPSLQTYVIRRNGGDYNVEHRFCRTVGNTSLFATWSVQFNLSVLLENISKLLRCLWSVFQGNQISAPHAVMLSVPSTSVWSNSSVFHLCRVHSDIIPSIQVHPDKWA